MKSFFAFLLSFLLAVPAYADGPVIPGGGGRAKVLTTAGFTLSNGTTLDNDGQINLFRNARAEDPKAVGWTTYNDGATAVPVDGTGGTPTISGISRTTGVPPVIDGTGSWVFALPGSNAQGQGWAYSFTVPANSSFRNSQVSLNFDYYLGGTDTDVFRIYVYDVTNGVMITPSFTTCGGGATPTLALSSSTCQGKFAVVLTTGTSYRFLIHVASTTTNLEQLVVDNFALTNYHGASGPGIGLWTNYTPVITNLATSTATGRYRQVGDTLEINIAATASAAATGGIGFPLPSGYTANTAAIARSTSDNSLGVALDNHSGGNVFTGTVVYASSTTVQVWGNNTAGTWNATVPASGASGDVFSVNFSVPVNELAGGTSMGENQVEPACSTTGTWNAAAAATDTVYGWAGCPISGALSGTKAKVVRFRTPQRSGEVAVLWLRSNGNWVRASDLAPYNRQGSAICGFQVLGVSGNDTDWETDFRQYQECTGGTFGAAGTDWAINGVDAWLLVKSMGGLATPFGLASNASPGLYWPGNVSGYTGGTAVCAGCVGETARVALTSSGNTTTGNTFVDSASFTLQPGIYDVFVSANVQVTTVATSQTPNFVLALRSGSTVVESAYGSYQTIAAAQSFNTQATISTVVDVSAATTYKVSVVTNSASTNYEVGILADGGAIGGLTPTTPSYVRWKRIQ